MAYEHHFPRPCFAYRLSSLHTIPTPRGQPCIWRDKLWGEACLGQWTDSKQKRGTILASLIITLVARSGGKPAPRGFLAEHQGCAISPTQQKEVHTSHRKEADKYACGVVWTSIHCLWRMACRQFHQGFVVGLLGLAAMDSWASGEAGTRNPVFP